MMRSLIFLLLFGFGSIQAQPSQDSVGTEKQEVRYDTESEVQPLSLDEQSLEEFRDDPDFDYTELEEQDNWWTRFRKWLSNVWNKFIQWLFGEGELSPFWAAFVRLLPYLIIIGIIAFVIWLFYKLNPGASLLQSKEKPEVFFTEEEEIIKKGDIRALIQKALENKEYRLAIRYYYLFILKRLTEAHIINYEFDKTNSDYMAEITEKDIHKGFSRATDLYDHIWYGNFDVTPGDFKQAERVFNQLDIQIPQEVE